MAISFKPQSFISGPTHFGETGLVFGCSQQGFSHCHQSKPCQDRHAICTQAENLTVAIADGHGDSRYLYSDIGAHYAAQEAIHTATQLLEPSDWLADVFPRWQMAIQKHAQSQNVSAELHLYGTTLQMLVLQDGLMSGAQIGDGSLWLIPHQQAAICLLQSTEELGGFTTRSLASPNDLAQIQFFQQAIPQPGSLLLMTTDGLTDSFVDHGEWRQFLASLSERVQTYGFIAVCKALPEWLQHYSREGCGDDMTVVLMQVP